MDFSTSILCTDGQQKLKEVITRNAEVFLPNKDGQISFTPYLQHKIHLAEEKSDSSSRPTNTTRMASSS